MSTATAEPLDRLQEYFDESQATYREMVLNLADKIEIAGEQIVAILSAAGCTQGNLQQHLKIAQRRKEAADIIDRAQAIRAKEVKIDSKLEAVNGELQKLQDSYQAARDEPLSRARALAQQKQQIHSQMQKARSAKQTLIATRSDQYDDKQAEILRDIENCHQSNRAGELSIKDHKQQADHLEALQSEFDSTRKQSSGNIDSAYTQSDRDLEARLQVAKHAAAAIERIEAETRQRNQQIPRLESRLAELEQSLFDWREMKFD